MRQTHSCQGEKPFFRAHFVVYEAGCEGSGRDHGEMPPNRQEQSNNDQSDCGKAESRLSDPSSATEIEC